MNNRINVTSPSMPPYEEYIEEIKSCWETKWLTHTGPKHKQLQQELEEYLDVKNVSLFANGHLALEAAIDALELTGEIITTPFTFASTTQAIARNGLTPVFCDINEEDYTMDVEKIEALITEKTSAIIPVHVYGSVCNVAAIEKIAQKHNLKVIYDAAHAFGMKIGEKGIGAWGDVSMFSFHATKVFNTIEGGGLSFSDDKLVQTLNRLKQFGMMGEEDVSLLGTNSKMTEFSAAMGLCNLRHIDEEISKRKTAVMRYMERLSGIDGVKIWKEQPGVTHNYAYFPVLFDEAVFGKSRDTVAELLAKENIFARKYFYPLTSEFDCYKGRFEIQPTPVAERISRQVLTLPLYAELTVEDVDRICDVILN